jgi:signal transduction histidine kinase
MNRAIGKATRMQLLPLVLIFAVLATLIVLRVVLIESQRDTNETVMRTLDLDRLVVGVLSTLQDAETGQRGYLLTGETPYRAPYDEAVAALPGQVGLLRDAAGDDQERAIQLGRLGTAVDAKLRELAETVDLQERGQTVEALAIIRSNRGKALMDEVRAIVAEIRRDENASLQAKLDESERMDMWLRVTGIGAALSIVGLALFGFLDMRRRLRDILAAHTQLAAANHELKREMASRQAAETQVRQMQKMEAVGQLTGGIAHDFNNMLAVIMSAMNLIERKLKRGETDIAKFVESALDAAKRAASLTGRLLAFSRQQPLAPSVIEANRMVAGMSDLLRRTLGESVAVETVLAGGLWKTHADPSQLENAILNLAVNGRDAMADGGKLTIETANAYLDDAYAAAHAEVPAGQYVMIAVTDTGTGMSPDVAAKAFEPFFTTKSAGKGTGLGLSQVFGFVKQSGGHVKIYSETGQGTTVKIYLPRHFGDAQPAAEPVQARDTTVAPTETILVVEDDERVRVGTVDALRELGYTVFHASSATEALARLEATPDVALLFTDIVMPGMNGRKLADEALKTMPQLKVLFTTGFTRNAVVHNGVLDHGVNFIAKPFSIDQLARKLREVLDA